MKRKRRKAPSTLENEVIVAFTLLYVLICVAILGIHYLQPAGQETQTSSTSPSHGSASSGQTPQKGK
jgi:hypothetical protein